jgi:hypothetical protein
MSRFVVAEAEDGPTVSVALRSSDFDDTVEILVDGTAVACLDPETGRLVLMQPEWHSCGVAWNSAGFIVVEQEDEVLRPADPSAKLAQAEQQVRDMPREEGFRDDWSHRDFPAF